MPGIGAVSEIVGSVLGPISTIGIIFYPSPVGEGSDVVPPMEMAKGGKEKGRNWATEEAKYSAQANGTTPCVELAKMLEDAKCQKDTRKIRDIEQAEKYLHCRNIPKRDSHY